MDLQNFIIHMCQLMIIVHPLKSKDCQDLAILHLILRNATNLEQSNQIILYFLIFQNATIQSKITG